MFYECKMKKSLFSITAVWFRPEVEKKTLNFTTKLIKRIDGINITSYLIDCSEVFIRVLD